MVAGKDVCLRRLAKGNRAREVRFNRFLGNAKVTSARVIEGWSEGTAAAAEGRHILAIQDTSEINFATTAKRRRGLGGDRPWQRPRGSAAPDAGGGRRERQLPRSVERPGVDPQGPPHSLPRPARLAGQETAARGR